MKKSSYTFERFDCRQSDTMVNDGKGMPVKYTGMTWSGFRPSDDACKLNYLVSANMFAAVVLGYIKEIADKIYQNIEMKDSASKLGKEIENGVETYGRYNHPEFGTIYAYETDGYDNYNLMDDANVPSLLGIPYIGTNLMTMMCTKTLENLLSKCNPYYFQGICQSIAVHTHQDYVWHIGLIVQGLTTDDINEIKKSWICFYQQMLIRTLCMRELTAITQITTQESGLRGRIRCLVSLH